MTDTSTTTEQAAPEVAKDPAQSSSPDAAKSIDAEALANKEQADTDNAEATKEAEPTSETDAKLKAERERWEQKISRQTAANREQQRRYEEALKKIQDLESRIPKDPQAGRPKQEDFNSIDEYADAYAEWKSKQTEAQRQAEAHKEQETKRTVEQQIEFEKKALEFKGREDAFREKVPSYDENAEVVNKFIATVDKGHPTFEAFSQALLESEKTPAIINYLGENPRELIAMTGMTPFQVEDAIHAIAEKLPAQPRRRAPKEEPLPNPPSGLKGSAKVTKSEEDMSGREWLDKLNVYGKKK